MNQKHFTTRISYLFSLLATTVLPIQSFYSNVTNKKLHKCFMWSEDSSQLIVTLSIRK